MILSRRRWFAAALALVALTPARRALTLLAGCGRSEPPPPDFVLRVRPEDVPAQGRVEVDHLRVTVELRREGEEVKARSMLCSHQLCRVEWKPEERRYFCPCHEGLFAEDGSVVYGPPKKPLRELTVTKKGDELWIDTSEVYKASPPEAPGSP